MSKQQHPARDRLALALDVDSIDGATALLRQLRSWFAVAKVGLQLFSAAGPDAITAARDEGFDVFADLKLHDIPNTVHNAARLIGATGARYLTVHAVAGRAVLRAGVTGFEAGAADAGHVVPTTLGVTILTSDGETPVAAFDERLSTIVASDCPGLVCSALDVARAKARHPERLAVCPGTRPAGSSRHDQARVATAGEAIVAGADLLVIGRSVSAADDPEAAADAIATEVSTALSR
jgi:orotidine-5'-phosphate decarboxylase